MSVALEKLIGLSLTNLRIFFLNIQKRYKFRNLGSLTLIITFGNFARFYHRVDAPQLKRNLISTMKIFAYELRLKLPNG